MKIAQKLILAMLAISLLPLLGFAALSYANSHNALLEQIKIRITNTATYQTQKLEAELGEAATRLTILSKRVQIRLLLDEYNKTGSIAAQKEMDNALKVLVTEEPEIHRVHLLNAEGLVVATTDDRYAGKNYADQEVFTAARKGSTTAIFAKDQDGELRQYLAAPLSLNGNFIGVVVAEGQASSYLGITGDYSQFGQTGESYLVRELSDGTKQYLTPLRYQPDAALSRAPEALAPKTDYRGHAVLSIDRKLQNGWSLVTKIDTSEINGPLVTQRNLTLLLLGGVAIVVIIVAWYLARFVTVPIQRLTEVALKVRQGDLDQQVAPSSKDEIGVLGAVFNEMVRKLAASYKALEAKVAERTQALGQKIQQLQDANAQDDAILNSIADGMIITDNTGKILLINTLAGELLGQQSTAIRGVNERAHDLYDEAGDLLPPNRRPIQLALTSGHTVTQVMKLERQDAKRMLNITATPVKQQGRIIGTIEMIYDITKQKEVDRMKSEFISIASHQLRTPLSAIKWFTEMLLSGDAGELKDEQRQFAQTIAESTERMIELVSSLLNISRIESGRIMIEPKPTDLSKLIQGVLDDLKAKVEERQQTLAVSVHKELPIINIDPHLIGQVYLNLLTNAIKYTQKGGEVSVVVSRKGDEIISQVSDNGYGIPKAEQSKMFSKFFRAQNVVKVESDGTGLGMYLVKAVIESAGGKIWFESEEGKGTTFWFSLPMTGMKAKAGEVTLE